MRLTILAFLLIMTGWAASAAQNASHTVRAGETLFSISREYNVSVQQLRQWNNLSDNTIHVGMRLNVGSTARPSGDVSSPVSSENTTTHTVIAGQTLFSISRIYDVTVDDIKSWNQLTNNSISIGQELVIRKESPSAGSARPTGNQSRSQDTTPAPREQNTAVAARTNERPQPPPSVTADWQFESTPQGKFVNYTISENDSLDQLLRFHHMDQHDFRALNPGKSTSDVRPGDEITLLLTSSNPQKNPYKVRATQSSASEIHVSRYPDDRRGKTTTSGDLYNPSALTAAHPSLSLGSVVYVENPETGHGLHVLINDRTSENRLLLSDAAFRALNYVNAARMVAKIDENPE